MSHVFAYDKQLYEQSAAYGHPGACFECGVFYEAGIPGHLEPNEHEVLNLYLKGHPD